MINVLANEACGLIRADRPRAQITGDNVTLGWSWVNPTNVSAAACLCTRHFEFCVPGVPAGEITVGVATELQ